MLTSEHFRHQGMKYENTSEEAVRGLPFKKKHLMTMKRASPKLVNSYSPSPPPVDRSSTPTDDLSLHHSHHIVCNENFIPSPDDAIHLSIHCSKVKQDNNLVTNPALTSVDSNSNSNSSSTTEVISSHQHNGGPRGENEMVDDETHEEESIIINPTPSPDNDVHRSSNGTSSSSTTTTTSSEAQEQQQQQQEEDKHSFEKVKKEEESTTSREEESVEETPKSDEKSSQLTPSESKVKRARTQKRLVKTEKKSSSTTSRRRTIVESQESEEEEGDDEEENVEGSDSDDESEEEEDDSKIYCICKQTYNPDLWMIACDECNEWYHGKCVHVTNQDSKRIEYYVCPPCRKKTGKSIVFKTDKRKKQNRVKQASNKDHDNSSPRSRTSGVKRKRDADDEVENSISKRRRRFNRPNSTQVAHIIPSPDKPLDSTATVAGQQDNGGLNRTTNLR